MTQQIDTVVIGAGQAGLAISYFLTQQGRTDVVLDKHGEVGSAWRDGRWDSFTLVTPNWSVRLPGFPYGGDDPDGFMKRGEVVSHLEQYASSFEAPVHCGVMVTAVDPAPGGSGYLVSTADGDTFAAANVVVATGSYWDGLSVCMTTRSRSPRTCRRIWPVQTKHRTISRTMWTPSCAGVA